MKPKLYRTVVHAPELESPIAIHHAAPPKHAVGLGDAVSIVAQPIAKFADALFGTDIANCQPCKKRREDWNSAVPDVTFGLSKPKEGQK